MKKPTDKQIAAEIAALKKLEPVGLFARKTAATIQLQLDALEGNLDDVADEFTVELSEEQQMAAMDALNWARGDSETRPSAGWGGLCA